MFGRGLCVRAWVRLGKVADESLIRASRRGLASDRAPQAG